MEFKGKVTAVRKSWDGMYPVMAGETGHVNRVEVEVELVHGGGLVRLTVTPKEATDFTFGQEITVTVTPGKKADG